MMRKIVISGGWSYGNIGDEAIAASTIFLVNKYFPQTKKIYTSYKPDDFYNEHAMEAIFSVHAVIDKLQDEQLNVERILEDLPHYHLDNYASIFDEETLFIMSGGGYLHEQWGSQFVARLLEIEIAKQSGAKCVLVGQSIGPFYTQKVIEQLKKSLNNVDYLSVRDESSKCFLDSLDLQCPVYVAPDLALLISDFMKVSPSLEEEKNINIMPASYTSYVGMQNAKIKNVYMEKIKKRFSPVSIRYQAELHKLIVRLVNRGYNVNIVLSTVWAWDEKFANKLIKNIASARVKIQKCKDYRELCQYLARGNITISTKMHPLIISASYGIPVIGIAYNYKVDDFMKLINAIDYCVSIDNVYAGDIFQKMENLFEENNKVNCSILKEKIYESFTAITSL